MIQISVAGREGVWVGGFVGGAVKFQEWAENSGLWGKICPRTALRTHVSLYSGFAEREERRGAETLVKENCKRERGGEEWM